MNWSDKYKKSIDCNNPKGFSQKAHCAGKKKSMNEMSNPRIPRKPGQPANSKKHSDLYTDENPKGTISGLGFKDVATAKQSVSKIKNSDRSHAHKIQAAVAMEQRAKEMGKSSEAAVYRKFINSMKEKTKEMSEESKKCKSGYYYCYTNKKCKPIPPGFMIDPAGMLAKENGATIDEEGLRDWFGKSKSKDGKPGWVQSDGSPCANEPGETKTPKCFSRSKLASMTKGEIASAVRRKREEDPGQQSKSGAASPTYVSTDSPTKKMKKEEYVNENHNAIADGKEKDEEGYMANIEMDTIDSAVKKLRKIIKKGDSQLPAWVQSKITKAADYIDTAADYLDSNEMSEMSEESDKKGKGSGTKDACYHKVKSRYSVWPSAYASGALVKCRKVGADNWGNKSESLSPISLKVLEDLNLDEKCWPGYKKKGMKTMFGKRYPNCVKVEEINVCNHTHKGEVCPIHGKKECPNEEIVYEGDYWHPDPEMDRKLGGPGPNQRAREDYPKPKSDSKKLRPGESYMDWNKRQRGLKNSYEPDGELIDESTRLQAETGNILAVILNWRGKTYSIRMFFPQIGMPSRKDVTTEIQKIYPGSQVIQYKVSTIEPGMPLIQVVNSKSKNYLTNSKKIGEEVKIEEDWQKENRKDKTDGLSQKAVNAYRRENPGSNLQTAVTEKKPTGKRAQRRKNFCSRMSGMKSKLTSAKTARDPDSKINKALRRWNCN